MKRVLADTEDSGERFLVDGLKSCADLAGLSGSDILLTVAETFEQLSCRIVALRVDAGHIERFLAAVDPQEACALFKCFRSQLRHLQQRSAVPEGPVLLAVGHDVLRDRLVDAGDVGEESGGGGVNVHADAVHAVLNDTGQGFVQLCLVHVMLILADSD